MLILGIETSCDETAAAVVEKGEKVRSSVISSQVSLHAEYGGVVPELACRAHLDNIQPVISGALEEAGCEMKDIGAVAVTTTPGLVGSLLVGVQAAKALAWYHGLPLVAVDHVHAHIYAARWAEGGWDFPAVALVVSGGHTSLYYVSGPGEIPRELGRTLDDAAGEAFDKAAKMLGLGYPGGPVIDELARSGNPRAVKFPRGMKREGSLDFSFSGLKTAVMYFLRDNEGAEKISKEDIAASFQDAVVEVLVEKTRLAARNEHVKNIFLSGGVAANSRLRARFADMAKKENYVCSIAPAKYCTDNAAMVAGLAYKLIEKGKTADLYVEAVP